MASRSSRCRRNFPASTLTGITSRSGRFTISPKSTNELDERVMAGFGGVAPNTASPYSWNKNFLKVIRLLIERRREFSMYGGVRFGGTLTIDSAFEPGFDHIALCAGAGRPTVIPMKNGLVRGVRRASDFLMALQLTGAAKFDSLANLQIRMPIMAAIGGGGLTAIDTRHRIACPTTWCRLKNFCAIRRPRL